MIPSPRPESTAAEFLSDSKKIILKGKNNSDTESRLQRPHEFPLLIDEHPDLKPTAVVGEPVDVLVMVDALTKPQSSYPAGENVFVYSAKV